MRARRTLSLAVLLSLVLGARCGVDQAIVNAGMEKGPDWVLEEPDPYFVTGQAVATAGGSLEYYTAAGNYLSQYSTIVQEDGIFVTQFPGATEYRNLVVMAGIGAMRLLGLAVRLPRNRNIYVDVQKEAASYHLGGMTWGPAFKAMTNLDDRTTAITLIMLRSAFDKGSNLGSAGLVSTNEVVGALLQALASKTGPAYELLLQVQRLEAAASASRFLPPLFLFPDATGTYLNPAILEAWDVDYSGDGIPDRNVGPFLAMLKQAADQVLLSACQAQGRMTVVLMADINEGNRDGNCNVISPFKHAIREEGKTLFVTGGMVTDSEASNTPACESDSKKLPTCITPAEWAEVNSTLGNWVPNKIPMRDDGLGGDEVAGDNVWTLVLSLPYVATAGGQIGVRIGYKFTYGFPGDGWTGTEEWPGNNRILEIEDVNTDAMVIRYDFFGDETSNKNKKNLNKGLCGSSQNPWPENASGGCFADTREKAVDLDGDCVADGFPAAGSVVPECTEPQVPQLVELKDSDYMQFGDQPAISAVVPGSGKNGGGYVIQLLGGNFHPTRITGIQVNSVDGAPVSVSDNSIPGFFVPDPTRLMFTAPRFPAEVASIVVMGGPQGNEKSQFQYTVEKTAPCSLLYPAQVPDPALGLPAAMATMETVPFLARLAVDDPTFTPQLLVELGMSPPCCRETDQCLMSYGSCATLPDPRYEEGWEFVPMAYDPECVVPNGAGLPECGGEAQFSGTLTPDLGKSRHLVVVRYSMDYGLSWDYCDLPADDGSAGNSDGIKWSTEANIWVE